MGLLGAVGYQLHVPVELSISTWGSGTSTSTPHSVVMAIFPGEPGLAGCPLNSPSPFIPGLRILLGQA